MKYVFLALLLLSTQAESAVRRLSECGAFSGSPTEALPFDLDRCALASGDDVTELLKDIQSKWPNGFYVRAPSKSITVISNTIYWPTSTKYYVLLEDQDPTNKLLIQHASKPTDFWVMWRFENFDTVKIGGANLSITFQGNHPGLANCDEHYSYAIAAGYSEATARICDINRGLLEFRMSDRTEATLADIRANVRYSQSYSIYTWGSAGFAEDVGTGNKIRQFNVAGLHFATGGVFFHQGVRHAWADPDRFVLSDPYVRTYGWTGETSSSFAGGLPVGCPHHIKDQVRGNAFSGYYTDSITGGMMLEYGLLAWVPRYATKVGYSEDDPFVVRIKDWGVSGPGTPYPAGVRVKKTGEGNFFKGDPHYKGEAGITQRFVRFEKLPDTFGSGPASGTSPGCEYSYADSDSNFARTENSLTSFPNRDWHITFSGDWRSLNQGGSFERGQLFNFAWDNGESYGHTLRAAAGTEILDTIRMYDRNTVTGPGEFHDIIVANYSPALPGRGNVVADTNLTGTVTVTASTGTTTIRNVNFTGSSRTVIDVQPESKLVANNLCAPPDSIISGTGTVVLDDQVISLPHVLSNANTCSISKAPIRAPTGLRHN
jgi:hypothetical protein